MNRRFARASCRDGGSAIVEFVFVAVVVLVPVVYLILAVAVVQQSQLAVSDAAREAGRAFATSDRPADAMPRVRAAVRLALATHHLPADATIRFVRAGGVCSDAEVEPSLTPGSVFTVCVVRTVAVPAVPRFVADRGITSVGAFVVHVDDFRAAVA